MKCSFVFLFLVAVGGATFAATDGNIVAVQNRLKGDGLYSGDATGVLDAETAAALTRFQIRHGLVPSGKLDGPTARELNASAPKPSPSAQPLNGTWRRLKSGEMQFIAEEPAATPAPPATSASPSSPPTAPQPQIAPSPPAEGPPVRPLTAQDPLPAAPPPANLAPARPSSSPDGFENPDRLRDYVDAFIQAGLDQFGSEAKFFADRVDYFGRPDVPREELQRDLMRYDKKWPHRRFWIDGDIQIQQQNGGGEIKLVFPLRYELRNGSRSASGKVLKSLTLAKNPGSDLQITAVSEWKAPDQPAQ